MMRYETATFFNSIPEDKIAYHMAEARSVFDPEMKKIREKISEHEAAIRKLEVKLGERMVKIAKEMFPEAKKKKEEARSIVELHKTAEKEYEMKLKQNKAL